MTKVQLTLSIFGDNFSPSEFLNHYKGTLKFTDTHEFGEVCSLKNEALDYGYASAHCSDSPVEWEQTESFIEEVANLEGYIRRFCIEEIDISCTVHDDGQCNMQFDPDYLKKISSVGASLSITCIRSDEDS